MLILGIYFGVAIVLFLLFWHLEGFEEEHFAMALLWPFFGLLAATLGIWYGAIVPAWNRIKGWL